MNLKKMSRPEDRQQTKKIKAEICVRVDLGARTEQHVLRRLILLPTI